MSKPLTLLCALLLLAGTSVGRTGEAPEAEESLRMEAQLMLEEAERARMEAESARAEAAKAAETARAAAQRSAERAQRAAQAELQSAEQQRAAAQERQQEMAREAEEMERAREELSRAHRELRAASREVARAHRELARSRSYHLTTGAVNLGDRAVIGLVLGSQTDDGVKIIGVSPDGPAERAGLQPGDVLVSLRGVPMAQDEASPGQEVRDIMGDVEAGEELAVVVLRNGEKMNFTVTAERREPRLWQSMIRIPDVEAVDEPEGARRVIVERIEIPEIDEEALAERVEQLTEQLKTRKLVIAHPGGVDFPHEAFEIEDFSDFGGLTMDEADVWFGLPLTHGLELARMNEGLGEYFKTDRGVLVIRARDDNAWNLESGDVILKIGGSAVESPADFMRALREVEPGSEVEMRIQRHRREKTLTVTVPENRLGQR